MHVEECCQAILHYILPNIDKSRKGFCIDIGVGTFALYCELFARNCFETVAVEPLPTQAVIKICDSLGINLIKSCVYDHDGTQTMYTGTYNGSENLNLSSIRSDWWGSSPDSIQVRSMTLNTLMKTINAQSITCLKLDVEGVESIIIKQLQQIKISLLPAVVMFEYGGGSSKQDGKAGWSESCINETLSCFQMLKELNYRTTVVIDSLPNSKEQIIDISEVNLLPDILFYPESIYGNAICFRENISDVTWIENICSLYRDNNIQPPRPLPELDKSSFFATRFRRMIRKYCK